MVRTFLLIGPACIAACIAAAGPALGPVNEVNPDLGRAILRQAESRPEFGRMEFMVPVPAVEAFLRAQVTNDLQPISDAPVPCLRDHWHAHLTIVSNTPSVRLRASGIAFRATPANPVMVPLCPAYTVVSNLKLNGRDTTPLRPRDCMLSVAVTNPGNFIITGDVEVRTTASGSERTIHLHSIGFTYSTIRVDSEQALDVSAPGCGSLRGTPEHGTHGLLASDRRNTLSVTWGPPASGEQRAGTPSVKPSVAWTVGSRILTAHAILDIEPIAGAMDRVKLRLPPGANHVQVSGADVKHSTVEAAQLEVMLRGPISGRTAMDLSFEVPRQGGSLITFPEIEVQDGRLDNSGWLLVANDTEGELLEQSIQGLTPRASLDAPQPVLGLLSGKPLFTYARTGYRCLATFDHVATTPFPLVDTIIDRAEITAAVRPDGEEMVHIRYVVRNDRKQFLRLALPAEARLLWSAVDGKQVQPKQEGARTLLPLAKSVQTMEGLIPLPVVLVYVRRGAPVAGASRRTMDLPEVHDVPTATIRVTVFAPDGTELRSASGALASVKTFSAGGGFVYGRTSSSHRGPDDEAGVLRLLSRNYFQTGYDAYRAGDFELAEDYLAKAAAVAPETDTPEVRNLLSNIRVGRGELGKGQSREQRARAAKVRKGMQANNPVLESRQEDLVQRAAQLIDSGNEELGAELLDEAVVVGTNLVQRGAAQVEQESLLGRFKGKLREISDRRKENEELNRRLAQLQKQTLEIAASADNKAPGEASKGSRLAVAISEAAAANAVALDEMQSIAFAQTPTAAKPAADVDQKVIALQSQGAQGAAPNAPGSTRAGRSLERENVRLRRQVQALEQAVTKTVSDPTPAAAPAQQADDRPLREARRLMANAAEEADSIARQVEADDVTAESLNEKTLGDRITALRRTTDAYGNTYAKLDPGLAREVQAVRERVNASEARLHKALEQKRQAQSVLLNVDAVAGGSAAQRQALVRFLQPNYIPDLKDNQPQLDIVNGRLWVLNSGTNSAIVADALEKMQRNRGLAVPVTGLKLDVRDAGRIPVIGRLFTERTGDGRPAAILDEAQYRALVESRGTSGEADNRAVIVGTGNRVAGENFRLARNGKDYNGVDIGGSELRLPNRGYLAIDNGTHLSILKAGAAVSWEELDAVAGKALAAPVAMAAPEVPCVGVPLYFEKTLLAAGESPDILLEYGYKERRSR